MTSSARTAPRSAPTTASACSYILALLDSKDLPHPPLEAVLTAMEEKGKVGAGHFDTSVLTGTRMIDFNWITDNEILAGCSGDVTFQVDVPGKIVAQRHGECPILDIDMRRTKVSRVRDCCLGQSHAPPLLRHTP